MATVEKWTPSFEGRRVMVTGATGFIGSRMVEALVDEGAKVIAIGRKVASARNLWPAGVYSYSLDICDGRAVSRVIRDVEPEILYHFAAHPDGAESYAQACASVSVNLLGTTNLLDAFASSGGKLFLFGDSTKVYGNGAVPHREDSSPEPTSSYAIAKSAAWQMCRLYGNLHDVAVASVRPTMIYGPGQGRNVISFVVETLLRGQREIPLLGGSQTRDPLFIEDAIAAFLQAGRLGPRLSGRVINIGGGEEISVHDLARRLVDLVGVDAKIVIQSAKARPTEIWRSYCDNEEARVTLDWSPTVSLDEGLQRTLDSMRRPATARASQRDHEIRFANP